MKVEKMTIAELQETIKQAQEQVAAKAEKEAEITIADLERLPEEAQRRVVAGMLAKFGTETRDQLLQPYLMTARAISAGLSTTNPTLTTYPIPKVRESLFSE